MSYQSIWIAKRDQILAAAERVKQANPVAWEQVKVPGQPSRLFIGLVAAECQVTVDAKIGCNLKRGGPDVSLDVLAMPNATGAADKTGTFPGLELIDIINGAEGPNPSLVWGDATQKTIDAGVPGGWIKSPAAQPGPNPTPGLISRDEFYTRFKQVNDYYAAPEGLKRPGGMVIDSANPVRCDAEAMGKWGYDLMLGKTVEQCKAEIRQSDEWKSKHPGETP